MTSNVQSRTRVSMQACLVSGAILLVAGSSFGQSASSQSLSGGRPTTYVLTDWNQFDRRNMHRFNPDERFLTVHNVGGLDLRWQNSASGQVWSSPAVADGMVYVGSTDHNLYALNAHTGAELWSYTTGNWVISSPAGSNGAVYVGQTSTAFMPSAWSTVGNRRG